MLYINSTVRGSTYPTRAVSSFIRMYYLKHSLSKAFLSYWDPPVGPFDGEALLLRQGLVFFDDLSDSLKVGADLRLGARLLQTIPRGFRIR